MANEEIIVDAQVAGEDEDMKGMLSKFMEEISSLRKEVSDLKSSAQVEKKQEEGVKALYGIRLARLENGNPHWDIFYADGVTVSMVDIDGLLGWFTKKMDFLYRQSFEKEAEDTRKMTQEGAEQANEQENQSD